jgi:hypothetical protein
MTDPLARAAKVYEETPRNAQHPLALLGRSRGEGRPFTGGASEFAQLIRWAKSLPTRAAREKTRALPRLQCHVACMAVASTPLGFSDADLDTAQTPCEPRSIQEGASVNGRGSAVA